MAVLSRLLIGSQQRIDLPDFLSIESYASSDFRELVRSFIGSRSIILKGFDIINAPQSIGTTSVSIRVADSVLYDPTSNSGSFFYGLPEGNALSQPLVLGQELRSNSINYIYLTLTTTGSAQDTRAFWDVDLNGGEGGEFNQSINTQAVLVVQAGVSTAGFPQGTIPVAKITFGASSIESITDCRNLMFRLGVGGTSPDPNNRFDFPDLPGPAFARSEPPSTINSSAAQNPFQGGDKNIQTLKEWMDAVMTKLVELSGTTYWYESTGDLSLVKVYDDALGSSLKSKGKWVHSEATIGTVEWTEDITYRKMNDTREIIVRAGSRSLQNNQVMWIKMVRNKAINALDTPVSFINGSGFVNGATGSFQYLKEGDWIKQKGDSEYHYGRVVAFYTEQNGGGSKTSNASEALSLKLESAYTGSTGTTSAVYTQGVYEPTGATGVQVTNRNSLDIYTAGGDMYWLANRSDTIQTISGISVQVFNSVSISQADGASAKLTFPSAHGLANGDRVVISNAAPFDEMYEVEVISPTEVTFNTTQTGTSSTARVSWAIVTTNERKSEDFVIESSKHGFASGQTVSIQGVTPTTPNNINGFYLINYRNDTQFQIPYNGNSFSPNFTSATATCAKVILKTDLGSVEVVQGEEININEPDSQNILNFIGMESLAETNPAYSIPNDINNNVLNGYVNYNSDTQDSLKTRVSRLTAMMADRVQDREIKISGTASFRNETSGSDQIITIAGSNLTIHKPGSPSQTVTLSSSYTLAENKAVVIDINRNTSTSITPSVVDFDSNFLLKENTFVLFYRFTGTDVFAWNGEKILNSSSWTSNNEEIGQNRNIIVNEKVSLNYDGTKLVFSSNTGNVEILIPGSSIYNRIDVSNFTSGISISNDKSAWIRVNRGANKTFTNTQTSATYQDTDAAGSIYVTNTSDVPVDQDVIVLYSIQSGRLVRHHTAPVDRRKIYEEFFVVSSNSSGSAIIPLPSDSRNGGATAYYINGSGQLEVALNGQILRVNVDYTELGTSGTAQTQIITGASRELKIGDVIRFRLASEGGFYTVDLGTTTTLQQAYGQGSTITIVDGTPVTINASAGYKALQLNGDLGVTGVIDPTGLALTPQAANPLGTDYGIWIDEDGNLRLARPGEIVTDINISESILNPSTFLTGGDGIDVTGSIVSVDLAIDPGLEFDTGKLRAKLDAANALKSSPDGIGITLKSTNPGLMIVDGSTFGSVTENYYNLIPSGVYNNINISGLETIVNGQVLTGIGSQLLSITFQIQRNFLQYEGQIIARIFAWDGDSETGVALAVSTPTGLPAINYMEYGDITFNFPSPVNLATGQEYIVLLYNYTIPPLTGFGITVNTAGPNQYTGGNWLGGPHTALVYTSFPSNFSVTWSQASDSYIDTKLDGSRAITSGTSGIGINLETTNPGVKITDNKLDVKLNSSGAITSGASGIGVAVDGTTIQIQSNQLVVAGVPNLLSLLTNNTGSNIAAERVVAASITTANEIQLASASSAADAIKTIGVAFTTINNGATGQVQTAGIATVATVGGLSLTVGKPAYLSPANPGLVTSTKPTAFASPVFMVGIAVDSYKVALNPQLITINTNFYRETYVVPSNISSNSSITLPTDSRNPSGPTTRYYVVGSGYLSVYLNGQLLEIGSFGYEESGTAGTDSNAIIIKQNLRTGDRLEFMIQADQTLAKEFAAIN